jgi:hypothetical protein
MSGIHVGVVSLLFTGLTAVNALPYEISTYAGGAPASPQAFPPAN